jgi:hypothetical protein
MPSKQCPSPLTPAVCASLDGLELLLIVVLPTGPSRDSGGCCGRRNTVINASRKTRWDQPHHKSCVEMEPSVVRSDLDRIRLYNQPPYSLVEIWTTVGQSLLILARAVVVRKLSMNWRGTRQLHMYI